MMTKTTTMMDFEYFFAPEPMELETTDYFKPEHMEVDTIYNTDEPTNMDIDVLIPSKKRRFGDVETAKDEEQSLCPPSKKKKSRKIIKATRPKKQVKIVPAILYIVF